MNTGRVKMMNIKETFFPKCCLKPLCSSRQKIKKVGGENEGRLIDKAFYCHWRAVFHFPHTPQTLWPHPSPSLIGFLRFCILAELGNPWTKQISWAGKHNQVKEIMAIVLIGWWSELDVWLWGGAAGVWSLTVLSVASNKQKLGHSHCSESCVLTALNVKHVVCVQCVPVRMNASLAQIYVCTSCKQLLVTVLPQWWHLA